MPSAKIVTSTGLPKSAPGAPVSYGPVDRWRCSRVFRSVTRISMRSMRISLAPEVKLLKSLLRGGALSVVGDRRLRVRTIAPRSLEVVPGGDAARLKIDHEIPQGGPQHVVREAWEPGDVDAQSKMLLESQIPGQLALHEGERPAHGFTRGIDLLHRVQGFQLHPVDAGLLLIGL